MKKNRRPMRMRRVLLPVVLLLLPVLLLTGCGGGKKIDASSLVRVEYSGLNGEGKAALVFDKEQLTAVLSEDKALTERQKETIASLADDLYKDYAVSKTEGLSNGDTIEITGALDKDLLKDFKCTINNDTVTVTVEGLIDPLELTASDYISFTVEGFDGAGTATAWFDSSAFSAAVAERWAQLYPGQPVEAYYNLESFYNCAYNTSVQLDRQEGLSNGDTVTASISLSGTEIPECGITLVPGEFQAEVSGLKQPEEVDLASAVTLSFSGVVPNVWVEYAVDYDKPFVRGLLLGDIKSHYETLQNGDTCSVEIPYDEELLRSMGYIAANTTVSAVVEGLPSIDFTLTGVEDPLLAGMAEEAEELAGQYTTDDYRSISNNMLDEREGWALWSGMRTALEREDMASISSENGADNLLFLTFHTAVPLRLADGTTDTGNSFLVMQRRTVLQTPEGTLTSENSWNWSRFATAEEAEAYVVEETQYRLGEEAVLTGGQADTAEALAVVLPEEQVAVAEADQTKPATESIFLTEMIPDYENRTEVWETMTDPYGNEYQNTLAFRAGDRARQDYLTGGSWNRFRATLTTYNEAGTDARMSMVIWGDDVLLFAVDSYGRSDAPRDICLDITGVQRLSVQTTCYGYNDHAWLFLSNGVLEKTGEMTEQENRKASFSDVQIVDANEMEDRAFEGIRTDIEGRLLRDSYELSTDYNGWMRVKLGGAYTRFAADAVLTELPYRYASSAALTVIADGETVSTISDLSVTEPRIPLELDVTGVDILEFRSAPVGEEGGGIVMALANTVLEGADVKTEEVPETEETVYAEVDEAVLRMFAGEAEEGEAEEESGPMELSCGEYRYMIINRPCNYATAQFAAQRLGGTLAMPKGARSNAALQALAENGNSSEYWIGAQRQSPSGETWVWADGEVMSETGSWAYGEPNNSGGNEDSLMFRRDGSWNDYPGDSELPFIIQLPAISGETGAEKVYLADLTQSRENYSEYIRTSYNDSFDPASLQLDADDYGWAEYDLGGRYETLSFDLHVNEESRCNERAAFAVFGDGRLLYRAEGLKRSDPHRYARVDVSGIQTLKLMSLEYGNRDTIRLDVVGAWLTPAEAGTEAAAADMLLMETVDASATETVDRMVMDSLGGLHPGWISVDTADEGYLMYNLAGNSITVSGEICGGPETAEGETAWVKILLDGQLAETVEGITREGASRAFEIDVTGAQTIRFETGREGENWENRVYLAGVTLRNR